MRRVLTRRMRRRICKPSNPVPIRVSDAGSGTALLLVTSRINVLPKGTDTPPPKLTDIWFAVKVGTVAKKPAALAGSMLTPEIVTPENRYCGPLKGSGAKPPGRLVIMISVLVKVVMSSLNGSAIDVDEEIVCGPMEKPSVLVSGKRYL